MERKIIACLTYIIYELVFGLKIRVVGEEQEEREEEAEENKGDHDKEEEEESEEEEYVTMERLPA